VSRYLVIGLIACAEFTRAASDPPKPAPAIPFFFEPAEAGAAGAPAQFALHRKNWSAVVTPASLEVGLAGSGAYRMTWDGAGPTAAVRGLDRLPGVTNYFVGSDASKWRTGIPQFQRVKGVQVYPGVDVDYYSTEGDLEYDVHIAPRVSPARVRMRFDGVSGMRLNGEGDLTFQVGETRLTHRRATAYQWRDGRRVPVPVAYQVGQDGQVGFGVGEYDRNLPLVIDPVLSFSTYLGDTGDDAGQAIAVDSAGFVYVIGATYTSGFEFFVAKLDPATSQIVYLTYLGSSGNDKGTGIAVDSSGQAYITGAAGPGFPLVNPLPSMSTSNGAVVAKLNATGVLIFSTLIGGSGGGGGSSIALDSAGNIYVAGYAGPGLPVKNPYQSALAGGLDAFVAKLDNSGSSLLFATYLGGSADDSANAVAVDPSGNVYVAGYTKSTDFPLAKNIQGPGGVTPSGSAGFVAKLDSTGSDLLYSTYLGSGSSGVSPDSVATGIAADAAGNAYVAGWTNTSNFPLVNPIQSGVFLYRQCFVSKFSGVGALVFSTLFGSSSWDECHALSLDSSSQILIAGFSTSAWLPLVDPVQTGLGLASQTGFVAMLDNGGSKKRCSPPISDRLAGRPNSTESPPAQVAPSMLPGTPPDRDTRCRRRCSRP